VADAGAVDIDHDQELRRPSTRGNIGMIAARFSSKMFCLLLCNCFEVMEKIVVSDNYARKMLWTIGN